MPLIQTIKSAQIAARKKRDSITASLLTTLIGEAEMVGKNANREVTDQEVVATIKKFIKNIDETIRVAGDYRDADRCDLAWAEKTILESFLPKQLSEDELKIVIDGIIDGLKELHGGDEGVSKPNMGQVMKELKTKCEGLYDGGLASKLIKEMLA
jgi:uncharacterized protein YqeY